MSGTSAAIVVPAAVAATDPPLPLVDVPDHALHVFFDPASRTRPPVVFFGFGQRLTSLHRLVDRVVMVSALGTLYVCNLLGSVTHTMPLSDSRRRVELLLESEPDDDGRRAVQLHYTDDPTSAIVLVFQRDDRSPDLVESLKVVLHHFTGGDGDRLRVAQCDDVIESVEHAAAAAGETPFRRWRRSLLGRGHSEQAIEQRALRSARAVAGSMPGRPSHQRAAARALLGRSSTRVRGAAVAPRDVLQAAEQQQATQPVIATSSAAAPFSAATEERRRADWKRRMERVYRKYCPERLGTLESALAKYAGHEEVLLGALVTKYGPEPPPTPPPPPPQPAPRDDEGRTSREPRLYNVDTDDENESPSPSPSPKKAKQRGAAAAAVPPPMMVTQDEFAAFAAQRCALAEYAESLARDIARMDAAADVARRTLGPQLANPEAVAAATRKQMDALSTMVLAICSRTVANKFAAEEAAAFSNVAAARKTRQEALRAVVMRAE